jgi:hypothetical protein
MTHTKDKALPFGVGDGLVAIKTLLSRDPCAHASTAIEMIDAILKDHPAAQPAPVQPVQEPSNYNEFVETACALIKAADDADADRDYMLDSDDCIAVLRGTWKAPLTNDMPKQPTPTAQPAVPLTDEQKDAARWRWLSEHIQVAWDEGKFTSLLRIVSDENRQMLNASIDRMMAGDWSDADKHNEAIEAAHGIKKGQP